uniref:Small ribosomal subunit protein bS18c n=1 Tax=Caulerpa lentillifera TaxID=148947 RepID=A0A345HH12_9CHLO|nr:ribosomal protein S18 [Caulerpa lentillifera]AXG75902.1 ribosomal protein S18 [Caulerpa lentillifera]QKS32299.1 ribosomal protein S18 [Caulerpa lentillifera]QUV75619.1 ribosomal protein S18 [Caulerpa lentillifera]
MRAFDFMILWWYGIGMLRRRGTGYTYIGILRLVVTLQSSLLFFKIFNFKLCLNPRASRSFGKKEFFQNLMKKPYFKRKVFFKKRKIGLTLKKSDQLNYKNIILLRNYITISGKIIPKRLNGLTAKQQRSISKAIKNARYMSFLPFVRLPSAGR